ncbi:hypothetical protein LZ32DRAFT_601135 [Colletotrichum eremochloae]|nr:hypothetical protein LZ32DRAFT_601135 [Colletotrichum eremochloae]
MAMEQVPAVLVVMGLPQQSLISHVLGFPPLHNMALPATLLPLEHGCKALFERDRGCSGVGSTPIGLIGLDVQYGA